MIFADGHWLNPPPDWGATGDSLTLSTGAKTDFWQRTHYGFQRDDGHFLAFPAPTDFDARLSFQAEFQALYDQAGIMLRIDARTWIKAGIERSGGVLNFSTVVTRTRSDWSVVPVPKAEPPFTIRLIRKGAAAMILYAAEGGWQLMRVADFPEGPATIGPMACTPERAGLRVSFTAFSIADAPEDPVHGHEA